MAPAAYLIRGANFLQNFFDHFSFFYGTASIPITPLQLNAKGLW